MDKIFTNSEEKWVKTVVLHGHSDNYLYLDEGHTTKIDKDTLKDLCLKGITVELSGTYYTPVFFKEESGYVAVMIATAISASASAATVLYSEEYSAE